MIYRTSLIPSAISISRQLKSRDLIALLVINDFPLHLQGVNVLSLRLLLYALIILINSDEMCVSVYKRLFEMELFSVKTDSLAFSVECFSPHFQITTRDQISYRQKFNFLALFERVSPLVMPICGYTSISGNHHFISAESSA